MLPDELLADLKAAVLGRDAELRAISKDLHANPELKLQEFQAVARVVPFLQAAGFAVVQGEQDAGLATAFVTTYESPAGSGSGSGSSQAHTGPTIAYCSEYDALPEIGHGCGHNLICIAGIAAALATKAVLERHRLAGRVVLFGTPGEEGGAGKVVMLDKGIFARHAPDVCMMLHPSKTNRVFSASMASQALTVEYFGKASHAAGAPFDGINALDAQVHAYSAMAMLRQHLRPDERVHGIFTKAGDAPNAVPDHTVARWMIRARDGGRLDALREKAVGIFNGAAAATGCTVRMQWEHVYDALRQNHVLADAFQTTMETLWDGVRFMPKQQQLTFMGGSTDMGNVTRRFPGIHAWFCIGERPAVTPSQHTREFAEQAVTELAHTCTLEAAIALAAVGVRVLVDPAFLQSVREEFHTASANSSLAPL